MLACGSLPGSRVWPWGSASNISARKLCIHHWMPPKAVIQHQARCFYSCCGGRWSLRLLLHACPALLYISRSCTAPRIRRNPHAICGSCQPLCLSSYCLIAVGKARLLITGASLCHVQASLVLLLIGAFRKRREACIIIRMLE